MHSDSLGYLLKNDYAELEKRCNCNNLKDELEKRKSDTIIANLQILITNLNSDPTIKALREQYHIMKHRGSMKIKGADDAPEVTKLCFLGQTIDSDIRAEHSVEEIERIIYDYHKSFFKHFTLIIDAIIPDDYIGGKIELNDYIAISEKIRSEMNKSDT